MQAWTTVGAASERADVRVLVLRASRHGGVGEPAPAHAHGAKLVPCCMSACWSAGIWPTAIVEGEPQGTGTCWPGGHPSDSCRSTASRARGTNDEPGRAAPDDRAGSCCCETADLVAAPATSADQPRDLERQRQDGDTEKRLNQARCDGRRDVGGEVEAEAQLRAWTARAKTVPTNSVIAVQAQPTSSTC